MTWWVAGFAVGMVLGGLFTLLRLLPWGKDWNVGGYP